MVRELASLAMLPAHSYDVSERVDELERLLGKGKYSPAAKRRAAREAKAQAEEAAKQAVYAKARAVHRCACSTCRCPDEVSDANAVCENCWEGDHYTPQGQRRRGSFPCSTCPSREACWDVGICLR